MRWRRVGSEGLLLSGTTREGWLSCSDDVLVVLCCVCLTLFLTSSALFKKIQIRETRKLIKTCMNYVNNNMELAT